MARNEIHSIEITFPTGVEVTEEDQQMLVTLADEICTRWENENPGFVMWPFGIGSKLTKHPMMISDDEPFPCDDSVFAIECNSREDYDAICAKCGHKQGDHKDLIIDPPAGDCDFEIKPPEKAKARPRGLVPMHVYLSAVKGRKDMREALMKTRAELKALQEAT